MADLFTADLHLGHRNIIRHCNRPFWAVNAEGETLLDKDGRLVPDSDAMDETLVRNWNAVVKQEDTVWIIGDLAYRCPPAYALSLVKRLNGHLHLIPGNHDELSLRIADLCGVVIEELYIELTIEEQKIVLCHYPMRDWHHSLRGSWHLFGHVHNLLKPFGKSFDVGVDCWNFFPISFEKVKDEMDKLAIGPHPGSEGYVPE